VSDRAADVNPASIWYPDADGDGFGDPVRASAPTCEAPSQTDVLNGDDCDDDPETGALRNPVTAWYADQDGDGYGAEGEPAAVQCEPPAGAFVMVSGDCDDRPEIGFPVHPDVDEVPLNGQDDDCDELELCAEDGDEDGFGSEVLVLSEDVTCTVEGVADQIWDLDDNDPEVGPATNCAEIKDARPSAESGAHELFDADEFSFFEAWCDHDLDGGGWTLVGSYSTVPAAFQELDTVTPTSEGYLDDARYLQVTETLVQPFAFRITGRATSGEMGHVLTVDPDGNCWSNEVTAAPYAIADRAWYAWHERSGCTGGGQDYTLMQVYADLASLSVNNDGQQGIVRIWDGSGFVLPAVKDTHFAFPGGRAFLYVR
jgi:hypothetical protein